MERKGSIQNIPNWHEIPGSVDMINELLTAFGRINPGTKGDVLAHTGTEFIKRAIGTNGQVLTADSAETDGVKWATPTVGLSAFSKKIGSFTRNTTLATGTQAVTGVGFQPQILIFLAVEDGTDEMSIGFDDGTNKCCISFISGVWYVSTSFSIWDYETTGPGADMYQGYVSALGSDGFTISWTKTDAPSGTLTVYYLALRIA